MDRRLPRQPRPGGPDTRGSTTRLLRRVVVVLLVSGLPLSALGCAEGRESDAPAEAGERADPREVDGSTGDTAPVERTGPDGEREGVSLRVEPATVSAGDPVALVLFNGSSDAIGYNLCVSEMELLSEEGWRTVPSDRVCTMELRTLPPGEEARFETSLPSGLGSGEYRYGTRVENLATGDRDRVRSDAFRVDG